MLVNVTKISHTCTAYFGNGNFPEFLHWTGGF